MRQIVLGVDAAPGWNLEDILSVEYPDGTLHAIDVDRRDLGGFRVEIGGNDPSEDIVTGDVAAPRVDAGDTVVFVLVFDYAEIEPEDDERLGLGFDAEQTWYQEGGIEQATRFRAQSSDDTSESVGITF